MRKYKKSRQLRIIKLLRDFQNGLTKTEIIDKIEKELKYSDEIFSYVDITFKRDLNDIRNDFNIEIVYNRKENVYKIDSLKVDDSRLDLMLNSFKIYNTFLGFDTLPEHIIPEKRKSNGLDNFGIISEAISEKTYIEFDYFKYDTNEKVHKKLKPFALKESKNRWYLIGSYENKEDFRAFGLDRISNLNKLENKFNKFPEVKIINNYYKDSFAMFTEGVAEHVVLSFDLRDGNYINSYPIHHTQKSEFNSEKNRYIISLNIKITLDFIMELMSRAWSLEVIEPLHLRQQLAFIFKEAHKRNQKK
jgi:proteasome accessory factor B